MSKILFAAICLLLLAAPASALDKIKAREAYHSASQHYNLGEFTEALRDFKEAYRNFEDPTILYNIAQCERQLGLKQDAIYAYKAYLRESPNPQNRSEVQQLIASIESALREEAYSKAHPPGGMLGPSDAQADARPNPSPAPVELTASAPLPIVVTKAPPAARPLYKKWWLWTAVAAVVVVGAGVGTAVALTRSPSYPSAQTSDGAFHF